MTSMMPVTSVVPCFPRRAVLDTAVESRVPVGIRWEGRAINKLQTKLLCVPVLRQAGW